MRSSKDVLREFKFSVLVDSSEFFDGAYDDQILLQGVIDCALIEEDGITILDFKTDHLKSDSLDDAVERHRVQVEIYARAMSRIFNKPVKGKYLYFFSCDRLIRID